MKYFLTKLKLTQAVLFLLIITLATLLRFWQIDKNPPALFVDEVSNGYNAYSILKTGSDEYGNFLPLTIRAFGDYNPALSVYLLIPSIALFGLNEFAVRFPSAFLSVLTVGSLFFLSLKLTKNKKIAYFSSLLLAISPWHLQFSRYDHEANFMLSFTVIGLTLFLLGIENKKYWIFSALSFALCLNSYHASKIWVPIIIAALCLIYKSELLKSKRQVLIPISILVISMIPVLMDIQKSLIRAQSVGILNSQNSKLEAFIDGYLSHFSPNFLFIRGDLIGRHSTNEMGQLYLFEMPLLIFGLLFILKTKNKSNEFKFLLAWLLLSPIPAALASPTPHSLRSINLIPVLAIISSIGIKTFLDYKMGLILKKAGILILVLVASYNIATYLHLYYKHEPSLKAADWKYGYKQMFEYVFSIKKEGQAVAVTNYYTHPYIYYLFYSKFDPKLFQQIKSHDKIGDYEFFGSSWEKPNTNKAILVRPQWQIPQDPNLNIIKKIFGPGQSQEEFFIITEE